jgi:hypothetical protein
MYMHSPSLEAGSHTLIMEPKGLWPCSQEPAAGPYSEPGASSPHLSTLLP